MSSMLWMVLMAIAVVSVQIARRTSEDIWLVLAGASAVISLIASLVFAPLPVLVSVLVMILVFEHLTLRRSLGRDWRN